MEMLMIAHFIIWIVMVILGNCKYISVYVPALPAYSAYTSENTLACQDSNGEYIL